MELDHYSKEWDDAPMPFSVFFTPQGHAIHGSYDTKHLGLAASHGCVRLDPRNAAILFGLVEAEGLANTTVTVLGAEASTSPGPAPLAKRFVPPPAGQPNAGSPAPWLHQSPYYYRGPIFLGPPAGFGR